MPSSVEVGSQELFRLLKEQSKPCTKEELVELSSLSERTVRTYLQFLFEHSLVKEMPNIGRTKLYAAIDYVPIMDEKKPLAQRWELYSQAGNKRFSVGELASYYGQGLPASSVKAAEFLLKAPALIVYYANTTELSDEELTMQLEALKEVLKEACDQLQSAIGVLTQLITDPRYWRPDLLRMFHNSPDYVLPKDLTAIISRLQSEMEDENDE